MSTPPEVSFIVPAYQARETIGEALSSLLAQTHKAWEAIVVDDGSTDDTGEIVRRMAAQDSRIQFLTQSNAGVSAARNTGLAIARGEWVVFLDADDWLEPRFLSTMLEAADERVDVIYCACLRVGADGAVVERLYDEDVERTPFKVFARRDPIAIHSVLTRRAVVEACGGFDPALRSCEDWDLWQRIARSGARFRGVPKDLTFYRLTPGSLSTNHRRMLLDGATVIRRGFGPDPRLTCANADLAQGDDNSALPEVLKHFVLWYAAAEVGRGGDGAAMFKAATPSGATANDDVMVLDTVLSGLAVGLSKERRDLLPLPEAIAKQLKRLLKAYVQAVDPGGQRQRLRRLEQMILDQTPTGVAAERRSSMSATVDLRRLGELRAPQGVDYAMLHFIGEGGPVLDVRVPVLGAMDAWDLADIFRRTLSTRSLVRLSGLTRRPTFWALLLAYFGREAARGVRRRSIGAILSQAPQLAATAAIRRLYQGHAPSPHRQKLGQILAGGSKLDFDWSTEVEGDPKSQPSPESIGRWEEVFAEPDPWGYGSAYEQTKYAYTLELLPDPPPRRALELGCAEGAFTAALAKRVERLIAIDISGRALERARSLCAGQDNVEFRQLDLTSDPLPSDQDLIVCSEVLYYLEDLDRLAEACSKLVDALAPGGWLLTANARVLADDASRTGFDWDQPLGGQAIHDTLAAMPGLGLQQSIETELYRVDLFRKASGADAPARAQVQIRPWGAALEPSVGRHVIWGGAKATRRDLRESEQTWRVPVLAYHRVADEGPAELDRWRTSVRDFGEQMRRLRQLGFHAVTSRDLIAHRVWNRAIPGRPILISFDDGYADFAANAWPILQANDFTAEVFIVTDRVGGHADWDGRYGPPAPLMDWDTLRHLHAEGARFGSHMASHTSALDLGSEALLTEAVRSREALETALQAPVRAIAAPYGAIDDRFNWAIDQAGYWIGFTCESGVADIRSPLFAMKRIEVEGGWSADDLEAALASKGVPTSGAAPRSSDDLVTVVIPAYNGEATLDQTLRSVRGQTHQNLEIIVVDDGSRDCTLQIALAHAAEDPRVRMIQQVNGGVARARNRGIQEAQGEWVAPIDADDLWAPRKIEDQLRVMKQGGPQMGLVYSWFALINENGDVIDDRFRPQIEGSVLEDICQGNFIGNGSAPLLRRSLVLECGGYEPALRDGKAQGCEDLLLYFRMAERCEFGLVREQAVGYREMRGAMSGDVFQMLRSYRLVAKEMAERHPQYRSRVEAGEAYLACWLFWKARRARNTAQTLKLAACVIAADWEIAATHLLPAILRGLGRRFVRRRAPQVPPARFAAANVTRQAEAA